MHDTMFPVPGAELCARTWGERSDPAILLIAGSARSMDWWDDEFCRRLAAGGRFVIAYDQRDTGRSTSFPAGAPPYTLRDLVADVTGLLDALRIGVVHLAGIFSGAGLALRVALAHPARVRSLTLMCAASATPGTRIGPGPPPAVAGRADAGATPGEIDWSDRGAVVDHLVRETQRAGGPFTADEPQLRRLAERVFDRTRDMRACHRNHRIVVATPPSADLLAAVAAPTLVLHGTLDTMTDMARARELASGMPHARLVAMEGVGHEFPPPAVWSPVVAEILASTERLPPAGVPGSAP
ncbi:alpha/beta fold hydrolase [Mangrovihabitans endophyticus]|uniref:AB hydrolase-1 domain-containing protein n=1 Tax=Mangrovihabitans endophyticus TaxID=1751298 RepID=A0A8J3C4L8_9ACTN|nr:alpha/beta hydrolase [Mangrovihabitans endophyticus]GGL07765.1 hypothetical protein GCM10012284_47700 [Mangrovihabitans endophyticus]